MILRGRSTDIALSLWQVVSGSDNLNPLPLVISRLERGTSTQCYPYRVLRILRIAIMARSTRLACEALDQLEIS